MTTDVSDSRGLRETTPPSVAWSSERSLRISWASAPPAVELHATAHAVRLATRDVATNVVPGAQVVTVTLSERVAAHAAAADAVVEVVRAAITHAVTTTNDLPPPREVTIPVRYGGDFGPDIEDVASHCGLSVDDVALRHAGGVYHVRFLGFSPGFGYLDGLPSELTTPRLNSPRLRVHAGSVGIAGATTGVYPSDLPGGWRIIGRTSLVLFDARRMPSGLLRPGDRVRFVPVAFGVSARGRGK